MSLFAGQGLGAPAGLGGLLGMLRGGFGGGSPIGGQLGGGSPIGPGAPGQLGGLLGPFAAMLRQQQAMGGGIQQAPPDFAAAQRQFAASQQQMPQQSVGLLGPSLDGIGGPIAGGQAIGGPIGGGQAIGAGAPGTPAGLLGNMQNMVSAQRAAGPMAGGANADEMRKRMMALQGQFNRR